MQWFTFPFENNYDLFFGSRNKKDCFSFEKKVIFCSIFDEQLHFRYEGLVLVCMYVIYIILMYFNKSIEPFMEGLLKKIKNRKHAHKHRHEDHNSNQTEAAKPLYYENPKSSANGTTPSSSPKADDETTFSVKNEEEESSSSEEKSSEGDEKEYHPAEGHKDCKFRQYRITNACFFSFILYSLGTRVLFCS